MVMQASFWQGKKVFLTGHTGFKGSWLALWLQMMGAKLLGYALEPPTQPNLFELASVGNDMISIIGDIKNQEYLTKIITDFQPEIVFHLAAQPLVRESYQNPVETYTTNVMGTVHLLEAIRQVKTIRSVVIITSDKCYENKEWVWGYRENDPMGGYDPYSSSKGCAELVTAAYRNSFFHPEKYLEHQVGIATARAGNVIGGGDWAVDRLVPDILKSCIANQPILIRNPHAIRPWQHVLDPLHGYLILAENLYQQGAMFSQGWNFGPDDTDVKPVSWLVEQLLLLWGGKINWQYDQSNQPHEANLLKLDCSKARVKLGWQPKIKLEFALSWVVDWFKSYQVGKDMRSVTESQINNFINNNFMELI